MDANDLRAFDRRNRKAKKMNATDFLYPGNVQTRGEALLADVAMGCSIAMRRHPAGWRHEAASLGLNFSRVEQRWVAKRLLGDPLLSGLLRGQEGALAKFESMAAEA
jgi:hypothetical protein